MLRIGIIAALIGTLGVAAGLMWTNTSRPPEVQASNAPHVVTGESVPMGEGKVWSWVKTDAAGKPISVGITMTESALRGLPKEGGHSCCDGPQFSPPLPDIASATPFKHIVINWNPQGHPPEGIYTVPHFDFHFYTITAQERLKIKNSEENDAIGSLPPSADQLPPDYFQAPGVVGSMGAHWIDKHTPEFNGHPFTATFLYGSYNGQVTFMEPMITKAFLESHPDVVLPLKVPTKPTDDRFVAKQYRIDYDASTKEITISMDAK